MEIVSIVIPFVYFSGVLVFLMDAKWYSVKIIHWEISSESVGSHCWL